MSYFVSTKSSGTAPKPRTPIAQTGLLQQGYVVKLRNKEEDLFIVTKLTSGKLILYNRSGTVIPVYAYNNQNWRHCTCSDLDIMSIYGLQSRIYAGFGEPISTRNRALLWERSADEDPDSLIFEFIDVISNAHCSEYCKNLLREAVQRIILEDFKSK